MQMNVFVSWSPRFLRRGSAASCLLGLETWMSVCCECCVSSGRGLCDGLITHVEDSYRVCVCVSVIECDHVQQTPLHLQPVNRRGQTKKERNQTRYLWSTETRNVTPRSPQNQWHDVKYTKVMQISKLRRKEDFTPIYSHLMFIGPCIIAIVDE